MASDKDVVIVAGGGRGGAHEVYRTYGIYWCQLDRHFREVDRIGFYSGNEIKREIPQILARRERFEFDRGSIAALRATGDPIDCGFAEAADRVLDNHAMDHGAELQLFLLSPPGDDRTVVLRQPIPNAERSARGRRIAWARGQRYASLAALQANPETTADLAAAEG